MPWVPAIDLAARLAPSAENRHWVQHLWLDPMNIELRWKTGTTGLTRQERFLSDISTGAMVENIALAAGASGFSLRTTWETSSSTDLRGRCRLEKGGVANDLYPMIPRRCTNRKPFENRRLTEALTETLLAETTQVAGVETRLFTDGDQLAAARLAGIAEAERLHSKVLHDEMFSGIRFEVGWRTSAPSGISPGSLEIETLMRPMFRSLSYWPFCRIARYLGAPATFGWRSGTMLARRSSAILVIASDLLDSAAPLAVGGLMQRIWLRATKCGLSVQPIPSAALFALPWWNGPRPAVSQALLMGWQKISPNLRPLMLLRLGWASPPSLRSGRP